MSSISTGGLVGAYVLPHHVMPDIMPTGGKHMRTTVVLDEDLLAQAEEYTGLKERSALLREALTALIQREAARRLARLGGSDPALRPIPRRRSKLG